jgi:hypothetical protein
MKKTKSAASDKKLETKLAELRKKTGIKDSSKKVDLTSIKSALKGEALKQRMSTKSSKSDEPKTALITKSMPEYKEGADYKDNKESAFERMFKRKSAKKNGK